MRNASRLVLSTNLPLQRLTGRKRYGMDDRIHLSPISA